jgi:nitroimidazol reductase NimA-like FMN-containing flavoprotein (pyridoxamine 5'-phosphate oxidase superfamily)
MTPTPPPNSQDNPSASRRSQGATTTEPSRASRVGDLARRVSHRRTELGLSTEELAKRAGVDAWFLAYFEQSSDTTLGAGALHRLAVALDTTPFALEGGDIARPPGVGRAGPHPVLESLTPAQCEEHLAAGGVGRIILSTGSGPVAFPVNFVFARGCVIFRTSGAMVANISGVVAFEIDHVDEAMSEGWSVLVRGHARLIEGTELRLVAADLDIEPWAGGARLNVVSIAPFEITGRVIVQRPSRRTL